MTPEETGAAIAGVVITVIVVYVIYRVIKGLVTRQREK